MENKITIALSERDRANVLHLIYAIDRHIGWDKQFIGHLAKHLGYNKDQLAADVKSLILLCDKIASVKENEYDRTHLEGWC